MSSPQAGRPSNSLHFIVGEMNGKLDVLLGLRGDIDALDTRVSALEVWRGRALGVGSVIVILLGAAEVIRTYVIR